MPTTNLGLQIINQSDNVSPNPINSNMETLDQLGLDYVTQQGTSGNWTYRRWKSGTFECWGTYTQQTASPQSGNLVQCTMGYPVNFAQPPVLNVNVRVDGSPSSFAAYTEHNTQNAQWYVGNVYSSADIECYLHAIGTVS